MLTLEEFQFAVQEIVILCTIAKKNNPTMWNIYSKNAEVQSTWNISNDISSNAVQKEVLAFWKHDWLLNDGDYYIKLLATTWSILQKYADIAYLNINLNKLIAMNQIPTKDTIKDLQVSAIKRLDGAT